MTGRFEKDGAGADSVVSGAARRRRLTARHKTHSLLRLPKTIPSGGINILAQWRPVILPLRF